MEEKDEIKIDFKKIKNLFLNKKFQLAVVFIILLVTLIWSTSIRTSNLHLLKDQTTGEYIPTALDPFYFLRMAETISQGGLPEFDPLRGPFNVGWSPEILPDLVVLFHKISNVFGDFSIQYIDVISPVIFYIIGFIAFFFLVLLLTKSKTASTVSSIFLAFIPSYIYRSTAGFADHESIGMAAFFLSLIPLILLFNNFEKEKTDKKKLKNSVTASVILGALTTLTIVAWGGIAKFVFMVVPLAFFLYWIINEHKIDGKIRNYFVLSYLIWFVSGIIFGIFTKYGAGGILDRFISGTEGIIFLFVFGFLIVDFAVQKYYGKEGLLKKYRIVASFVITIILGFLLLPILGMDPFSLVSDFFSRLIHPFGTGRVGLTVAENKQPFLQDWTSQIGPRFFWIFLLGSALLGIEMSKIAKKKKDKYLFAIFWIAMILGISLSRISSSSILNGTNFISKLLYFGGIAIFGVYALYLYFNKKINGIDGRFLVFASLLIPMIVGTRGAVRLFFVITPVTCMMVGYGFDQVVRKFKSSKEEMSKLFFGAGSVIILILLILSFNFFVGVSTAQAKYTGPSANGQWQKAMEWVRDNTAEKSVFVHWWDYGYWVQYLGERKTIADGGHFQGEFRDHMIGRYVLTNPVPDLALSFMKSNEITNLLIDPTDLGKYGAYSSIGSDKTGSDRNSWIPLMPNDPRQTQETQNTTLRVFQGGFSLDKDIIYSQEGNEILLPQGRAAVIGVILDMRNDEGSFGVKQPIGVYLYNDQQIRIPIKNIYVQGQLIQYEEGVNATVVFIPSLEQTSSGTGIDNFGAMLYLSEKTENSLFAQMYLMDDPLDKYPTIKLAHSQDDPVVESLKSQGANLGEFIYYQGFRGPIKIWDVDYPDYILEKEEFLRRQGKYAEFDDLEVRTNP